MDLCGVHQRHMAVNNRAHRQSRASLRQVRRATCPSRSIRRPVQSDGGQTFPAARRSVQLEPRLTARLASPTTSRATARRSSNSITASTGGTREPILCSTSARIAMAAGSSDMRGPTRNGNGIWDPGEEGIDDYRALRRRGERIAGPGSRRHLYQRSGRVVRARAGDELRRTDRLGVARSAAALRARRRPRVRQLTRSP